MWEVEIDMSDCARENKESENVEKQANAVYNFGSFN